MTQENFNTLESLKDRMEKLCIHGLHRKPDEVEKNRIDYLCGEFGLNPVDWNCAGCIKERTRTLYAIYTRELKQRDNGTDLA